MKYKVLEKIIPKVKYDNGFIVDDSSKKHSFYNLSKIYSDANWSESLAKSLEEVSKNHFIDRYNRKIVIEAVKNYIHYNNKEEMSFIDIGCSNGYLLGDILNNFNEFDIYGADYYSQGLIECHKRIPQIPLFQMDILDIKIEDEVFDVISFLNVLEHIEDDKKALNQIYNILKKNGLFIISVPMSPCLYDMYDEIHFHVRRYKKKDLINKISKAGFKIQKFNYFGSFIYPPFYARKRMNKFLYDKLSFEEKNKKALNQAGDTKNSRIMNLLCNIEYMLGNIINYPFGIRGYVIATK